jgi:spore coat polysaccharide biosynthesis predicted glycosyltransferase SpsG
MRLIVRADASASVGTGHVMRSSTIAAEFLNLGHSVHYVGQIEPMNLILERFQEIGLPYPALLPEEIKPSKETDILLIDSYTLDPTDPFIARKRWFKTCSISDSVTPNFDVDLIINPSLSVQPNLRNGTRVLSGPDYTLLRSSLKKSLQKSPDDEIPLKILIVGGGSDPSRFCNELVKFIRNLPFDFIADIFSDNFDESLSFDSRIKVNKVGLQMNAFAEKCDLVLTLASSQAIEFIAREIPLGVACAFDNQKDGFHELVSLDLAVPIGQRDILGKWKFDTDAIVGLISSEKIRNQLRLNSSGLIDMKGPQRIATEILSL